MLAKTRYVTSFDSMYDHSLYTTAKVASVLYRLAALNFFTDFLFKQRIQLIEYINESAFHATVNHSIAIGDRHAHIVNDESRPVVGQYFEIHSFHHHVSAFWKFHELGGLNDTFRSN